MSKEPGKEETPGAHDYAPHHDVARPHDERTVADQSRDASGRAPQHDSNDARPEDGDTRKLLGSDTTGREYDGYESTSPSVDPSRHIAQEPAGIGRYEERWGNRGGVGRESAIDEKVFGRNYEDERAKSIGATGPARSGPHEEHDDRGRIYREGEKPMKERLTDTEGKEPRNPTGRKN